MCALHKSNTLPHTAERLQGLVIEVISVAPEELDAAKKTTTVTLHLFNKERRLLRTVARKTPTAFDDAVTAVFAPTTSTPRTKHITPPRPDSIARFRINTLVSPFAFAVLVITQRPPKRLLGQADNPLPILETLLQGEVEGHHLLEPGEQRAEIALGSFEADPQRHERAELQNGCIEVVAAFAQTLPPGSAGPPPRRWSLLPIRESFPLETTTFASPTNLKNFTETTATTVLDKVFGSGDRNMYGPQLVLEDILDELLHVTARSPVKLSDQNRQQRRASSPETPTSRVTAPKRSTSAFAEIEVPTTDIVTTKRQPTLPQSQDHTFASLKNESESLHQRQRQVTNNVRAVLSLLRDDSTDFTEMSKRIYAEPWRDIKRLSPARNNASSNSSSSEDSAERRASTIEHSLNRFRRDLRAELLEALEHYARRDSPTHSRPDYSTRQLITVQRELQLLQQRQNELDTALIGLIQSPTTPFTSSATEEPLNIDKADYIRSSPPHIHQFSDDPLVTEFVEFTRSLEQVTQLTGESFRRLQSRLHYPEAFRDLARGTSYPCARKLLEFVSSKKATTLVEDIETLAGMWRGAGTHIPRDPMSLGAPDLRDFGRKPWWTLRPYDYAA